MKQAPCVGITVLPEYIQNETIERVLDAVVGRAGANAVSVSPYVMAPADFETGTREPPADASAGSVRLLDRPLWGRRELFVRTAPSFVPDRSLYARLRYQPPDPDDLTLEEGPVVADFIRAAKARGLKVYHQVQAAIPPGYRVQFGGPEDDDLPRLPDGNRPEGRVDKNASLASPHVRAYIRAMVHDLCRAYPEMDGLRIDWPEYPPYTLDSAFLDFGPHAEKAAGRLGFDFARMRSDAAQLRATLLGEMNDKSLVSWLAGSDPDSARRLLADRPGIQDWLRFKAVLAAEIVAEFRASLTEFGGSEKELIPNVFPAPWSLLSGANLERFAPFSSSYGVKLYTMHWPMIIRFYADALLAANSRLSRAVIMRTLARAFDVADDEGLDDYAYPEPDEPHPIGLGAIRRKIEMARLAARGTPVAAIAHGYGPLDDFRARLSAAFDAADGNIWINRYGYLSDDKLDAIGAIVRRCQAT